VSKDKELKKPSINFDAMFCKENARKEAAEAILLGGWSNHQKCDDVFIASLLDAELTQKHRAESAEARVQELETALFNRAQDHAGDLAAKNAAESRIFQLESLLLECLPFVNNYMVEQIEPWISRETCKGLRGRKVVNKYPRTLK
jgi:hypothetical protein